MSDHSGRTPHHDALTIEAVKNRLRRGGWHPSEYDDCPEAQDDWYSRIARTAVEAARPIIQRQTWAAAVSAAGQVQIAPQTHCSERGFEAARRRIVSVLKRTS